jgi:hypothetical protein
VLVTFYRQSFKDLSILDRRRKISAGKVECLLFPSIRLITQLLYPDVEMSGRMCIGDRRVGTLNG